MRLLHSAAVSLTALVSATAAAEEPPEIDGLEIIVERYCGNIRDSAVEARILRQTQQLEAMEAEIEDRIAALEERQQEYRHWVAERARLMEEASEQVSNIYAEMRPDAAALQLVEMDPRTAAAVLARLDTRAAGAIMAEMKPEAAGYLATVMAGNDVMGDARELRTR